MVAIMRNIMKNATKINKTKPSSCCVCLPCIGALEVKAIRKRPVSTYSRNTPPKKRERSLRKGRIILGSLSS
jgi:hypothetical protein